MTDNLYLDGDAVTAAADTLNTAAGTVPLNVMKSLADCGSSTVASAAESFALWARITSENLRDQLEASSTDAKAAVEAFQQTDKTIADAAGGM